MSFKTPVYLLLLATISAGSACVASGRGTRHVRSMTPRQSTLHRSKQSCAPDAAPPQVAASFDLNALPYPLNLPYEQLRPLLATLPCPLPGIPAELARQVDCSLMKQPVSSYEYEPFPEPPGDPYATVDHRWDGLAGPVRDQGQVGSCYANALASFLDSYARRRGRADLRASALHVFSTYGSEASCIEPRYNAGPDSFGIAAEEVWPYSAEKACSLTSSHASGCGDYYHMQPGWAVSDPRFLQERSYADTHPSFRLSAATYLSAKDVRVFDELAKMLRAGLSVQATVDMALNWSSKRTSCGCDGSLPPPAGFYGAHAVLLQGYRWTARGRQFLLQNSWGAEWADNGFGWVDEAVLRERMRHVVRYQVALVTDPPGYDPAYARPARRRGLEDVCTGLMHMQDGVCVPNANQCIAGMRKQNGICVPDLSNIPYCGAKQWPTLTAPCRLRSL